ncbi:MAG: ribonuclease R [Gammaproteobacteria bacterium]|nr:MAG: ribonuclease R [Gammaproteobacteria bacterium]
MSKKKSLTKDPYQDREAQKYENPIPSREYIMDVLRELGHPATQKELNRILGLKGEEAREALRRRLIAMCRDGQLICNRAGAYGLVSSMHLIKGRVLAHKDGFGFVRPEEGGDDLYLNPRQMKAVFEDDIVLVREDGRGFKGKREARIVEVVKRNTHQVVGRYFVEDGVRFIIPENPKITQDILVTENGSLRAEPGQIVVVEITRQPDFKRAALGRIVEIVGEHMAPGMETDVALRTYKIPFRWAPEVEEEVDALPDEVTEPEKTGRVDIRHLPLVTIDGEDARAFDDAVYCERKRWGGWRLYVAIADVSHYVKPGSALDREAFERGTSVYFPNRVVPMLPEKLSNGLCSLNPSVDRLCMVCEMTISSRGRLSGFKFYEGVMHSHARLTYNQVETLLNGEGREAEEVRQRYDALMPHLKNLKDVYKALRSQRDGRGAIDFETVETRVFFNEDGKIEAIRPVQRGESHKIIEECMLAANVATARLLAKLDVPILYRVHAGPAQERLEKLRAFLAERGLELGGGDKPGPKHYRELVERIQGRPDADILQTVILRSLSQAVYQPENLGHFGLAYEAYTHFTSPIRRYPDLLNHRAIRWLLRSGKSSKHLVRAKGAPPLTEADEYRYTEADMVVLGEHCSMTERRADDATRDVMAWLKCEYLQDHVGEVYEGIVSAVTGFGLFVELKELYVEGLVHVSSLPGDYYQFDEAQHRLVGERTRQVFCLGDEVKVRVMRVNLAERKIDFELEQAPARKRSRKQAIIQGWAKEEKSGKPGKKPGSGKKKGSAGSGNRSGGPKGRNGGGQSRKKR